MPEIEMSFPAKGIDLSTGYDKQPPFTTPIGENVRAFDSEAMRARGGSRPGLARYIDAQVGGVSSVIQHLNIIVDPTVDALLDNFDYDDDSDDGDNSGGIDDPSSGGRGRGRRIRRGGTGRQPNKSKKKTPKLTWSNPSDIRSYIPLTGTQLNCTATDPVTAATVAGTFTYAPLHGTVLPVGNGHKLSTTFVPTDTTTYNTYRRKPYRVFVPAEPRRYINGQLVGRWTTVYTNEPNRKRVTINVLASDIDPITSVHYHGIVSSNPFSDARVIVGTVLLVINGGAPVSLGGSGVLTNLADSANPLDDVEVVWPGKTTPNQGPPYGYFFVGS